MGDSPFLVKDINPAQDNSGPSYLGVIGKKAILSAYSASHGRELWCSDGTSSGTLRLSDIFPGAESARFAQNPDTEVYVSPSFHGGLLIPAGASDGSAEALYLLPEGLSPLQKISQTIGGGSSLGFIEGFSFFGADDDSGERELWSTDGTEEGTQLFLDLRADGASSPGAFVNLDSNRFLFGARTSEYRRALFISDGTVSGTKLLWGGTSNQTSIWFGLGPFNGKVFYPINDGSGGELWVSDGTVAGTKLFLDIDPNPDSYLYGRSDPRFTWTAKSYFTFTADDGIRGREVWRSDGTLDGTYMLREINEEQPSLITGGAQATGFTGYEDITFFLAKRTFGAGVDYGLWRTDGTTEGTVPLKELNELEAAAGDMGVPKVVRDKLYFSAPYGDLLQSELWVSDGTPEGTQLLFDVAPNDQSSSPSVLGTANGFLLFSAKFLNKGFELGAVNLPPWVESIAPVTPSPTAADEAEFLVTFNEMVHGVDPGDFVLLEDGTVGASVLSATTADEGYSWTVRIDTGDGDGSIRLRLVDDDSVRDNYADAPLEGNGFNLDGSFTGDTALVIDKPPPSVRLSAEIPTTVYKTHVHVTATFDTPVTEFGLDDLALVNATALSDLAGTGTTYTFTLVASAPGAVSAQVQAGAARDAGLLFSAPSPVLAWTYQPLDHHSADTSQDLTIQLTELLRVIQLYNATLPKLPAIKNEFTCLVGTEDGYTLEFPDAPQDCPPHAIDYNPCDWRVSLSELLRIIQFYNAPMRQYHPCPQDPNTEDGFCPGE